MLSDMFLLVNSSSFKYTEDNFYQIITDNAVYFCAMELSCKKVRFLEEIGYWYNYATGDNIFKKMQKTKLKEFMNVSRHIEAKKSYQCFHDYLLEAYNWKNEV